MKQKLAMKVGARNSAQDSERLQKIHDLAVENGATCAPADAGKSVDKTALKATAQKYADLLGAQDWQAIEEGYDIAQAAGVLSGLASLAIDEASNDEPDDVKELCALMRALLKFIGSEIDEMEALGGDATEEIGEGDAAKSAPPSGKIATTATSTLPAQSTIAIPAYVKSLHLTLSEQQFKDVLAVKFVGKNELRGYSNLWGDPERVDIETEFFTNAKSALGATNFWDSVLGIPRPLTWNHAQDGDMFKSSAVIGEIIEFGDDDVGRFYNAVLDRSHKYRAAVAKLITNKSLGTSSDSAPQYVERVTQKNGSVWLKQWPLFAAALTDVPCEPRMLDIGSPYWKSMGVDTKLLRGRIAEAGHGVSRDEMAQRLQNAERGLQVLRLYTAE